MMWKFYRKTVSHIHIRMPEYTYTRALNDNADDEDDGGREDVKRFTKLN